MFDAAGFLAGLEGLFERVYTTPLVLSEVKDSHSRFNLELAISGGKVIVIEPSKSALARVRRESEALGESGLSDADLSVAALALDLSRPFVLTDDLALQNLLASLGIRYGSVKLGITLTKVKRIIYVCPSCGRTYPSPGLCYFCGNRLLRRPVT
ncbi:MAG: NOB1 family endonuclease [Sulfolobaceae archaeon]|nr:NOB1 family endonuclease [Sulfolobales archaeon]